MTFRLEQRARAPLKHRCAAFRPIDQSSQKAIHAPTMSR
jgi:hypothetical protein